MNAISRAILAATCAVASVASQDPNVTEVALDGVDQGRYYLIEPQSANEAPKAGHGLLVVLPGGDGGEEFLPFVQQTVLGSVPPGYLGVMVHAIQWSEDQQIVWPTARTPALDMKVSTEDYVAAVVRDVAARRRIDPGRMMLLGWSSSGPAAYDIAMREGQPFRGYYVAMSVFRRNDTALPRVEGLRFTLDQSPEDSVTPFRFAARAYQSLTTYGAEVWLRRYQGGHGWHDDPASRLRQGLAWLDGAEPAPTTPADVTQGRQPLQNGGFELGTAGWLIVDNSGRLQASVAEDHAPVGNRALHLKRAGDGPTDFVRQEVELPRALQLRVSARVRTTALERGWLRFRMHDARGELLHEDTDFARLRGDRGWREVTVVYSVNEDAAYGVFEIVMPSDGEVWVDDVRITTVQPSNPAPDPVR